MAENALLITVDSLRRDQVAPFRPEIAPNVAELASRGVVFEQAIANGPQTASSFPSILTGTYPLMYGGPEYLTDDRPFLAAALADAGYTTIGYHSNPHLSSDQNYDHGFTHFDDGESDVDVGHVKSLKNVLDRFLDWESKPYQLLRRLWRYYSLSQNKSEYADATTITEKAVDWVETRTDNEFFMWLHFMDVHYPYNPPDEFLAAAGGDDLSKRRIIHLNNKVRDQEERHNLTEAEIADLKVLYEGEVRYVDHEIGKLLDALERDGSREETAVFVTADHGDGFGEHGTYGHTPSLYDELLRVPLIVDDPESEPHTVAQQVALIDLPPTICSLLGVEPPARMQGRDLGPLLRGDSLPQDYTIAVTQDGDKIAYRSAAWKLLLQDGDVELYDLAEDPGELADVSESNPEVVAELREQLDAHLDAVDESAVETPEVEQSEEVKTRLRELGYME